MAARLVLLDSSGPVEYRLGGFNRIGRHPDCSIQISEPGVSKEHCNITLVDGSYVVHDLRSRNGTYVNDAPVEERALRPGDVITVGRARFRFEVEGEEPTSAHRVKLVAAEPTAQVSAVETRLVTGSRFLPAAEVASAEALRADYEKLRVAHELSQRLSLETDLGALLQKIVDETFRIIPAERAVILLADTPGGPLVPRYARQKRDEEIEISRKILHEVRVNKRAVLSGDVPREIQTMTGLESGYRPLSAMCVPLLYQDEVLGAIHMDTSATRGAFTEKDLRLFTAIATQAAVAIQNHHLAKKIEREAQARAQLERLVAPHLVEELLQGRIKLDEQGSLREVTMLFADIRGFTALSERLAGGPHEIVSLLNEYYETMVDVLFAHGGTLDKYVGDELIGLFGAPVDVRDAPLQAVRCALDMLRALEELNRARRRRGESGLRIGIGINTGLVVAGAIGSSRTLQYTVIGDAVNVAARLCGLARHDDGRRPGDVIVSESTFAACGDWIEAAALEPERVKGKQLPLRIYRVIAVREEAPRSGGFPRLAL